MRAFLKALLTTVCVLIGILLVSNFAKGVNVYSPDLVQIKLLPGGQLQDVASHFPEAKLTDAAQGIFRVPDGQAMRYIPKMMGDPEVEMVLPVAAAPSFDFKLYGKTLWAQIKQYASGDLGSLYYANGIKVPITQQLGPMLGRSFAYFLPGLFGGVLLGLLAGLLAVLLPKLGRVFDFVHGLMVSVPDFLTVILLQFAAMFVDQLYGGRPVILIMQFVDDVPFLIPFLVILIQPAILIYGTVRIAFAREWEEGYVKTAYMKGLSRPGVLFQHLMRNTWADLLSILPRAVSVALSSLVIAEVITAVFGVGGYMLNPDLWNVTSLLTTCSILALVALAAKWLCAFLYRRLVVDTKEVG